MKKIALAAFGLMLAASPAFADSVNGFGNEQANNNTVASNNDVKSYSQTNTNTDTTTNTTSNTLAASDSFNKSSSDVDVDVAVKDSFNKTDTKTTNTTKVEDSFNKTDVKVTSTKTDDSYNTKVEDSYNTSNKTENKTTNTTTNTYAASDSFNSTKTENKYDVSAALSIASLSQVSTGNKIEADSKGKFAGAASVNSGSVSATSVSTSGGVITNNINTGAVSNVGALTAVAASTR